VPVLSGPAVVASPSAGAATAVQPQAPVYDALPAVFAAAALHEIRIARVGLMLTPIRRILATVVSASAIVRGHLVCL